MNINNNIGLFHIIIKNEYYNIIDLYRIIIKMNINNNIDLSKIIIKNEY